MNGYNFTERVRKTLAMSREEAARLHHEYVGTEHILLALVREDAGVATAVLRNLGVEPDAIRRAVEAVVRPGTPTRGPHFPDLPYTTRAKKAFELSMTEAREMRCGYVDTEHFLLGLLREEQGIAGQELRHAGVTLEAARAETVRLLGIDPATGDRTDV
jgi:ATP-dependent Clp protease ATP-binding subunit ClpC